MSRAGKETLSFFVLLCAPAVFVIAADGMLRAEEPFYSWFYSFAWWSYIAFLEAFLYQRGGISLLFDYPLRFLLQLPISLTVWLIFEAFNFRLQNWHYFNITTDLAGRWAGYAISFATVLPGIFVTLRVLEHWNLLGSVRSAPLQNARRLYVPFLLLGALFFVLPLLWPHLFFPLVWLGFIFLLEPLNHRLAGPSLLADLEHGRPQRIYLLLIAGAICGFLWEFWNFRAGSKWIYTIPYVGRLKIFEMPLLGFFGFPPFALECYIMTSSFFLLEGRLAKRQGPWRQRFAWVALWAVILFIDALILIGIDRFAVISWANK